MYLSQPGAAGGQPGADQEGAPRAPNPQHQAASKRIQQTQAQVDEVVGIMRVNVEKVLERDQKLSDLDDRADALQQGASQFEQQAGKLKRKFWWKNCKMWAILIGVIAIIIIIIIVYASTSSSSSTKAKK
ncbi:neuronal Synaptobrevin isoform X2 [Haemaphysalis longicornis]